MVKLLVFSAAVLKYGGIEIRRYWNTAVLKCGGIEIRRGFFCGSGNYTINRGITWTGTGYG